MLPRRSGRRIIPVDKDTLIISVSLSRRWIYLVCFILLVLTFILNVDLSEDFSAENIGPTLFIILIALASLGAFLYCDKVTISKKERTVLIEKGIRPFFFNKKHMYFPEGWEIVLCVHRLLEQTGLDRRRVARFRVFMETRSALFRIMLKSAEGSIVLGETTDPEEGARMGTAVSSFLGINLKKEETR